ncbi:MAG TPA: tellurite resistance/C4-dicarboxylate transporter family protein [Burkholderiales bacterium]|nr:tellurite resistance/C4-dicarboxylate transporter family protein [Burkholderiales bacterium]
MRLQPLRGAVQALSPAYFALAMATGIVSLAAHMLGMAVLSRALFVANIVAYGCLWLLNLLRIVWFPREIAQDLADHARGPGFFTWVAASAVLGSQFVVMAPDLALAHALWALALVLWIVLTYTVLAAFTVKAKKPPLEEGISGAWLLAVVATQSVAVLSADLAPHSSQPYHIELNFLALSLWLWGGMLYIWMISLIFYRYAFFRFLPGDLSPPYWINMGAMAISTLAGSLLIVNAPDAPFLGALLPFIKGFTVLYWATGTWWIPMLLVLGFWRYVWKRFPLRYSPLYWGAVFPLGMYSACTFEMAHAMKLSFLEPVPRYFLYVALAAWAATFIGLARSLARGAASRGGGEAPRPG